MKVDLRYSLLPWGTAISNIINDRSADLKPSLIVRGDDPKKVDGLLSDLKTMANTFPVRLGHSSSMAYIGIELLEKIDPKVSIHFTASKLPHEKILILLRKRVLETSHNPVIILDRCQHLHFTHLFRVLRLVNDLEGKALFLFLLPEDYARRWFEANNQKGKAQLDYFLKLMTYKYAIHD